MRHSSCRPIMPAALFRRTILKLFPVVNKPQARRSSARDWLERRLTFIDSHPFHILALVLFLAILVSIVVNMESLPPQLTAGENDTWWAIALNLIHNHGYSLCLTRYFPFCGLFNQATAAREPLPVLFFAAGGSKLLEKLLVKRSVASAL